MTSALPNEKWSQLPNSDPDFSENAVQGHIQWHPFGGAGFGDAYCKVRANILFRFRGSKRQEFFACAQRDWRLLYDLDSLSGESDWETTILRRHLIWSEAIHRTYDTHRQEQAVLVDYVQSVEKPKEQISSLVWFDTVEGFESLLLNSWYQSAQRGFVRLGTMRNWELCIGSDDPSKPASEVIKRTTETMQYITGNQWDTSRDDGNVFNAVRNISGIGIDLTGKEYGIIASKLTADGIELLDVLLGPVVLV